jgi:hypothetical protein
MSAPNFRIGCSDNNLELRVSYLLLDGLYKFNLRLNDYGHARFHIIFEPYSCSRGSQGKC